jgi:hypothetical protein
VTVTTIPPERITTMFTTLPTGMQWGAVGVAVLLLLSWLYLLLTLRAVKRGMRELVSDVRDATDRFTRTAMEQQGELIRRVGWAVTYLEHIEQKIDQTAPPDMRVSSITAENLVVRAGDGNNR